MCMLVLLCVYACIEVYVAMRAGILVCVCSCRCGGMLVYMCSVWVAVGTEFQVLLHSSSYF